MNNILEVIRFEVVRNIKKPSFWIASLALPIGLGIYFMIVAFMGYDMSTQITAGSNIDHAKIGYYDDADYIKEDSYKNSNGEEQKLFQSASREAGINDVKEDRIDVFFYLPKNFYPSETNEQISSIEIYAKPDKNTLLDDYTVAISDILKNTAQQNIRPEDLSIITNAVSFENTVFNHEDNSIINQDEVISHAIIPGIAIAMFYLLICVLGNRLVAAMVEEKENRISELLLTNINPKHFILGKIFSLMIVGLLQLIVLIIPLLIIFIFAKNNGLIPFDFQLDFSLTNILKYGALLIAAYALFSAFCVLIGVVSNNIKDANNLAGFVVILFILPMIFMSVFPNNDNPVMLNFLSYFPPTAPLSLMFRGVFENVTNIELMLGLFDVGVVAFLIMKLAAHIYQHHALGFNSKIDIKQLMSKPRKTWKN